MQRDPIATPADALPVREDHIRTADGWTLPVTVTSPGPGAHGTVVICPALGVPRQFYGVFARALCLAGWRVVSFDYRGIGEALATGPGMPRFADWGTRDIDAVLKWVHDTLTPEGCGGRRLVVLGHSAGATMGITAIYNRYSYTDEKRAALSAWARWLDQVVTGEADANVVELRL